MIIKRYVVNNMKEALVRAKYELGQDAVIIDERPIMVGKWYNPFKEKKLEVTLGVEEPEDKKLIAIDSNFNDEEFDPFYMNSSDEIKDKLVNFCKLHDKEDYHLTLEESKEFMKIALRENPLQKQFQLGKINAVIGPTGVGKTTTLAKIAAHQTLEEKKNVGMITMDTYRIGAVEQLRTYANILGTPFEIVNEPSEMREKIEKLMHCDIILIDTLGTSPKNDSMIDDINKYFRDIEHNINKYLVLSISSDKDTTLSILNRYKRLNYDSLILTKLDEVENISNMWYVLENINLPIQFFCHGQDVPDDITDANLDSLMKYIGVNRNVRSS